VVQQFVHSPSISGIVVPTGSGLNSNRRVQHQNTGPLFYLTEVVCLFRRLDYRINRICRAAGPKACLRTCGRRHSLHWEALWATTVKLPTSVSEMSFLKCYWNKMPFTEKFPGLPKVESAHLKTTAAERSLSLTSVTDMMFSHWLSTMLVCVQTQL